MPIIKIPEVLREKLSPKGADALVEVLNQVERSSRNDVLVLVEEKFERRLSEQTAKLERSISQAETRILRWLVVLWASQIAAAHFWK